MPSWHLPLIAQPSGHPTTPEELKAGGLGAVLELVKLTHSNVTTDEFEAACRKWMNSATHPRRWIVPVLGLSTHARTARLP